MEDNADRAAYENAWAAVMAMVLGGKSFSGRERNCAFLNLGEGRFADLSGVSGLNFADDGRCAAAVDWDLDGDLDLWLTNRTGPRLRFMANQVKSGNHFVAVRLTGTSGNRDAIGARLTLQTGDGPRVRTLRAGEGFMAQSSKWVHFGLSSSTDVGQLTVRWPGGEVETFHGLTADQRYTIVQDSGEVNRWQPPRGAITLADDPLPPAPMDSDSGRVVVLARPPVPDVSYVDLDGVEKTLEPFPHSGTLLTLWASWCAPCRAELAELEEHREAFAGRGLQIVGLTVDKPEDLPESRKLVAQLGLQFDVGTAPLELLDLLETMQNSLIDKMRPIGLPTSFLLDAEGDLAVIYRGAVEMDVLEADLDLLPLSRFALREAGSAFAGRWYMKPVEPSLGNLAATSHNQGRHQTAAQFRLTKAEIAAARGDEENEVPALLEDAIAGLQAAIDQDAGNAEATAQLGRALTLSGRRDEATAALTSAAAKPLRLLTRRRVALDLLRCEQPEAAMSSVHTAVQADPRIVDRALLDAVLTAGTAADLAAACRAAIPAHPVTARQAYAELLRRSGDLPNAAKVLQAALTLNPDDDAVISSLARIERESGDATAAIQRLEPLLLRRPQAFEPRKELALALSSENRPDEAVTAALAALELRPDDVELLSLCMVLKLNRGQQRSAFEHYERLRLIDRPRAARLLESLRSNPENGEGSSPGSESGR